MTSGSPSESTGHSVTSEDRLQRHPRLRLEFHSDSLAEPFRAQFETDLTIIVDSVVQLSDGTHLQYWTVTDCPQAKIIETVVEFPTTIDARLLSTVDTTSRIEVHGSRRSLFSTFSEFEGETRSAVYDEHGVHVVADFPPNVVVTDVEAAVHEIYPDLELVSSEEIRTTNVLWSLVQERLTDRQRTTLQLAYFGGYYEQPRRSTGEELADRMGISKQAFHEHLRKAYATIFEQLFEDDGQQTEVDS